MDLTIYPEGSSEMQAVAQTKCASCINRISGTFDSERYCNWKKYRPIIQYYFNKNGGNVSLIYLDMKEISIPKPVLRYYIKKCEAQLYAKYDF